MELVEEICRAQDRADLHRKEKNQSTPKGTLISGFTGPAGGIRTRPATSAPRPLSSEASRVS